MFQTQRSLLAFVTVALFLSGTARAGRIELLSKAAVESDTADGVAWNEEVPASSADGRWIAFASYARNLVAGQQDPRHFMDVFLHDRQTGTTVLASHEAGTPATAAIGGSTRPSISADGRWIAYLSQAVTLIAGQSASPLPQAYLYDRDTDTSTLVSRSTTGPLIASASPTQSVRVSADGNWIAFVSHGADLIPGLVVPAGTAQVFLFERATGEITLASRSAGSATTAGSASSEHPSISADGRYVAFRSFAGDLIPGFTDGNGSTSDVFLFDRVTGTMALVSRSSASATHGLGGQAPSISADGSAVAFVSAASNLAAGQTDTNNLPDVFLFDRATGTNLLASRSAASPTAAGNAGTAASLPPRIADDGSYVAFTSQATDAVPGQIDTPGSADVFLFRRSDSFLSLVSRSSASSAEAVGGTGPSLSADGLYVAFESGAGNVVEDQVNPPGPSRLNVFLYDRTTGVNVLASGAGGSGQVTGNGFSNRQVLSADGALLAFQTSSTDLVAGVEDRNRESDVALFDRAARTLALASLHAPGMASASPSGGSSFFASVDADGRYAVLLRAAGNLVPGETPGLGQQVYLVDRDTGGAWLVSHAAGSATTGGNSSSSNALISADGSWIAFSSFATDLVPGQVDTPSPTLDVFLYERATGTVTLVSHAAGFPARAGNAGCEVTFPWSSVPGPLSISADGRYLMFVCQSGDLVPGQIDGAVPGEDVFLYDRVTGGTSLVSRSAASAVTAGNDVSGDPAISPDGRYVAFSSFATDLVPGATDGNGERDVFLYDRITGEMLLASRAAGTAATAANGSSSLPDPSSDGRFVVFDSSATNLVPGQTDPARSPSENGDVFLFDRVTGTVELISRAAGSSTATASDRSGSGVPSADGRWVLFGSEASNLVPGQAEPGPNTMDLFVHDRVTRTTELITHAASSPALAGDGNASAYTLSPDGRFVAFLSTAANLVPGPGGTALFVADRQLRTLERVAAAEHLHWFPPGRESSRFLSYDGSTVFFTSGDPLLVASDYNGAWDAFAYVRNTPSAGSDFFTLPPCRLLDTRQLAGALVSDHPALLTVPGLCGIPETATALALNVTVVQPGDQGRLTVHPGNLQASTSTLNFAAGETRCNNTIVPLAYNGEGTLGITPFVLGGGTVHVVVDVTGYFE